MRILIVNTSERVGGAAIAARRLCQALNDAGDEARMLVRDRQTDSPMVSRVSSSRWHFLWERARIWLANGLSRDNLWLVDIANTGTDITRTQEFKEADVIHLHWVNQGFLSMKGLQRIIQSGKPVVWTLHDQWPYTGICHYADSCDSYLHHCHYCPLLARPHHHDLSYRLFRRKQHLYRNAGITFVGCSQWITDDAKDSPLTQGNRVVCIPNVIPDSTFHPFPQTEARAAFGLPQDKRLVLFGSLKATDARKGLKFLSEACKWLRRENIALVVAGNASEQLQSTLSLPIHSVGYVTDEQRMAQLYAAADVFVTPSLQDNLPNTIAEAMSCGTPCVGFRVGGIPEMIHHKQDGYVAHYRNAQDLAEGIRYVLSHPELRGAAARYAAQAYNSRHVAQLYIEEYQRLVNV